MDEINNLLNLDITRYEDVENDINAISDIVNNLDLEIEVFRTPDSITITDKEGNTKSIIKGDSKIIRIVVYAFNEDRNGHRKLEDFIKEVEKWYIESKIF